MVITESTLKLTLSATLVFMLLLLSLTITTAVYVPGRSPVLGLIVKDLLLPALMEVSVFGDNSNAAGFTPLKFIVNFPVA
jgi:hypothetical protein